MMLGYVTIIFAIVFLTILILLHFLKPEFDPSWRMISEYAIGNHGWLMRVAFICWGASVLTLVITLWPTLTTASGLIGRWWLLLITLALVGAAVFKTNPITDLTPNLRNTIHSICGAIVILTFPIVSSLVVSSLLHNELWLPAKGQLLFATLFTWVGVILFFSSIIISRKKDPSAGRVGPTIYMGWPNRILVVADILWLCVVAANAQQVMSHL